MVVAEKVAEKVAKKVAKKMSQKDDLVKQFPDLYKQTGQSALFTDQLPLKAPERCRRCFCGRGHESDQEG